MRRTLKRAVVWMGLVGGVFAGVFAGGCQTPPAKNELADARLAVEGKQFDDALRSADAYLAQNPSGDGAARAHYLRGRALEGRPKRSDGETRANLVAAKSAYERALMLSPDAELRSFILTSLGNANYWLEDYAGAERSWAEAYAALGNEDLKPWVLYRVGLSQQRQGKFAAADSTFAQVRQKYPNNEAADRAKNHQGAKAFFVQVAAFQNAESAEQLVTSLKKRGLPAQRMLKTDRNLQVAMVGPMPTYREAAEMKQRLAGEHPDAMIVP